MGVSVVVAEAIADTVLGMVDEAERSGRVLGVRMPVDDEHADEPWRMSPSRRSEPRRIEAAIPKSIRIVVADQVYIDRTELPPALMTQFIRLAAFQNPEFYRAQAMRLPTFGKPRIISCAELHPRHVALPRGCLDEAIELIKSHGVERRFGRSSRRREARYLPACRSRANCGGHSRRPSMLWSLRTTACWLPRPPSARRLSPRRSSRIVLETRWFSFIAGNCSPNGWSV